MEGSIHKKKSLVICLTGSLDRSVLYETFIADNFLILLSSTCSFWAQNMSLFCLLKFGNCVSSGRASARFQKSALFSPWKENSELLLMTSRLFPITSSHQNELSSWNLSHGCKLHLIITIIIQDQAQLCSSICSEVITKTRMLMHSASPARRLKILKILAIWQMHCFHR